MSRSRVSDGERLAQAPWPYLRIDEAAKRLGVTPQFLEGLCNNGIRAFDATREQGQKRRFWLLNRDDVLALQERTENQCPGPKGHAYSKADGICAFCGRRRGIKAHRG